MSDCKKPAKRKMKQALVVSLLIATLAQVGIGISDENPEIIYVKVASENLRDAPKGRKLGTLAQGTRMTVLETRGNWVKVAVEGWIWKPSTTDDVASIAKTTTRKAADLELIDFDVQRLPADVYQSRFSPEVVLTLKLRNNTQKRIKAWRALLIVKDAFGDILFRSQLTSGAANIAPGETALAHFSWEDNRFIDDEPYDELVSYSKENLRIELTNIQLIQ